MRIDTFEFAAKGPKLDLMAWTLLLHTLLQASSVVAAPSPNVRRDAASDRVVTLFQNTGAQAQSASQEGSNLLTSLLAGLSKPYAITQNSNNTAVRSLNLGLVRSNFLYGNPVGGGGFYPSGLLGVAKSSVDLVNFFSEFTPELALTTSDLTKATADSGQVSIYCPYRRQ
jgi:hypothetical protein